MQQPKLEQVPDFINRKITLGKNEFLDEYVKHFKNEKLSWVYLYISNVLCNSEAYDHIEGDLLAIKNNSLQNSFVNYSTLCNIFNSASIYIKFPCLYFSDYKPKYVNISSDSLSEKYKNNNFSILRINISEAYDSSEGVSYFNSVCSFTPTITIKGEKIFDDLLSVRNQIIEIYDMQQMEKKYKPFLNDFDLNQ